MLDRIMIYGLLILFLVASTSAVVAWYKYQTKPVTSTTTWVPVPVIKTVEKIKKVNIPGPERIVVVEKQVIVEKLKLPEPLASDPNKQFTATAAIPPYEGTTNVVSMIDTKTGVSEILAKQVPLPFFAFEDKKEIGVRVGLNSHSEIEANFYGRWSFLRVGSVHFAAYGESGGYGGNDSQYNSKLQLEVSYRF